MALIKTIKTKIGVDVLLEKARVAADDASFSSETGESKQGQYDSNILQTVKGLMFKGQLFDDSPQKGFVFQVDNGVYSVTDFIVK